MFKLTVAQGGEVIYVSGLKPRDPATLMDYKGEFYVVLLKKTHF